MPRQPIVIIDDDDESIDGVDDADGVDVGTRRRRFVGRFVDRFVIVHPRTREPSIVDDRRRRRRDGASIGRRSGARACGGDLRGTVDGGVGGVRRGGVVVDRGAGERDV